MLKKKSIVLSDTNGSNKKAVLSLQEDGLSVKGTLRLYNFATELFGVSSLGFYVDKKVYKAGLTQKSHMFYEFFLDIKEIPNKFSCAVVNFQNAVPTPILYGSSSGNDEDIYSNIITEISQNASFDNTKKVLDKYDLDFAEEEKETIEKEIDDAMCEHDCANCVYKKFFYEHEQTFSQSKKSQEKSEKIVEEKYEQIKQTPSFVEKLMPQIDKLFENNPIEENLQKIIPTSKWVKVEYEDDGDFFVFGLLYDDEENIKYVCYGVPSIFDDDPPEELAGYPIWLPLDQNNSHGFGYWLTYQDASTGEPIKAIVD